MDAAEAIVGVISALYFMLPAYLANMAPVIVKKVPMFLIPIDAGRTWKDGRPIFGSHKTWRGLVFATLFGAAAFAVQQRLYSFGPWRSISLVDYAAQPAILGVLLGLGAILGDLAKSFAKRRVGVASGKPWIPFDEIDFVIGALLFSALVVVLPLWAYGVIIVASPLLHIATNHAAFYLKIRKEKW
jgi:CDP-2,3-bis-(O-geranylgeranyl)-sn-glycerol synthase